MSALNLFRKGAAAICAHVSRNIRKYVLTAPVLVTTSCAVAPLGAPPAYYQDQSGAGILVVPNNQYPGNSYFPNSLPDDPNGRNWCGGKVICWPKDQEYNIRKFENQGFDQWHGGQQQWHGVPPAHNAPPINNWRGHPGPAIRPQGMPKRGEVKTNILTS